MEIAVVFPHTLDGSLGSTVRVRELLSNLVSDGFKTTLYSPYEQGGLIWNGVLLKTMSNFPHNLQLKRLVYSTTRRLYYNHFFINNLYLKPSFRSLIAKKIATSLKKAVSDRSAPDLIQAEDLLHVIDGCLQVGKELGIPIVADLHNIVPEELVAAGIVRKDSSQFKCLQEWMKNSLTQVDGVVVVSKEMKRYVRGNYGIAHNKLTVVPPGGKLRKTLKEKQLRPSVVYSGMLTYREHVDLFIRSMPYIKMHLPKTSFYLTRKGEMLGSLTRLCKQLGVNPNFFWYPDLQSFYIFLSSCHVAVLPSSNNQARRMGTPAKLFDYMSVGLPVVTNYIGGWSEFVRDYRIGLVTKDCPKEFADAVKTLLEDKELAEQCGKRAMELVCGSMSWKKSAKTLQDFYRKILVNE